MTDLQSTPEANPELIRSGPEADQKRTHSEPKAADAERKPDTDLSPASTHTNHNEGEDADKAQAAFYAKRG